MRDCDERALAHGLAISSVQALHHWVLGATAEIGPASRVFVYLCFV